MTLLEQSAAKPFKLGLWIVAFGVLIGIFTAVSLEALRPMIVIVMCGGLLILLPTFLLKNPFLYWLFLLVVSIPFDIYKSLSRWIIAPEVLIGLYGPPTAGNASLDFFLTDALLLLLVLHWFVRLALGEDRFYFPKVAYFFVLYLIWSLIGALIEAESLFVACLEWCRQFLYFLSFLYVINNVKTPQHLRTIVFALFVGLGIGTASVIAFGALDVGTNIRAFDFIFGSNEGKYASTMYAVSNRKEGDSKRIMGMFSHPAIAAAYIGLTVPLALAFLAAARRWRDAILFLALAASAYFASYLTFSRAGLIALIAGSVVLFPIARWARLISQQKFLAGVFMFVSITAGSTPLLISYLETRPASYYGRFEYAGIALQTFWQRPMLGAGLNNGSSAIKEPSSTLSKDPGAIPCHYLVILVENGLVGFLLFFAFFGYIATIALRSLRVVDNEMKIILAGLIGGMTSIAIQNLADNPLAGHSISALVWLFAGLTIVIARGVQFKRALPTPQRAAPVVPLLGSLAARSGVTSRNR